MKLILSFRPLVRISHVEYLKQTKIRGILKKIINKNKKKEKKMPTN
jgi:hypothetical protein